MVTQIGSQRFIRSARDRRSSNGQPAKKGGHMKKVVSILVRFVFIAVIALSPTMSFSHGGRLNSQGCHAGKQPYHCHRSASSMVPSTSGGYRLKCSSGSRSSDCNGGGYAKRKVSVSITDVQRKLYYHCPYVGRGFVDGKWGPNSERVLRRFQAMYGLVPDGVIGSQTLAALNGKSINRC